MNLRALLFLVFLLLGYAGAITAGFWIWPGKYDAISAWAVALTGGVVLWYTWETMHLRLAAYAQKEIQLRPFVVLNRVERVFRLKNLGAGLAVNVKVNDVVIDAQEQILVRFPETIPLLSPGEERDITAQSFHGDANMGDFFAAHLDPKYAIMDFQVDIGFHNVEMKLYRVSEKISPGRLEILGVSDT